MAATCRYCNAGFSDDAAGIVDVTKHEARCPFNPNKPPRASSTVEAFRRFGERLEQKAHDTKKLADEMTFGNSATLVATAIMCVANEARAFADELEKEGWGQ